MTYRISALRYGRSIATAFLLCAATQSSFSAAVADYFQPPLATPWTLRQSVGEYYSLLDSSGVTHSLCGKHLGDDVKADPGTSVVAIANGIVRASFDRDALGHAIHIEHQLPDGSTVTSVYYHLLKEKEGGIHVPFGKEVKRGEVIGTLTSNPKDNFGAPHLHIGIRNEGFIGYRGGNINKPLQVIDSRTNTWYYPGYTTHFQSVGGTRRCDVIGLAADESMTDHDVIVNEWVASPKKFIEDRSPPNSPIIYQPANDIGVQDIWTTSVFSFTGEGGGPGGGLNDDRLVVGGWGDLYYSLIAFDLNTLPTTASKVELQLYMPQARAAGTTALYLDRITAFWDWRTQGTGQDRLRLWWVDRPAAEQWIATALPAPIAAQWYTIDITTLYNGWKAGTYPNYGIQLRPVGAGDNTWADFVSSNSADAAHRPRLVVTP